MEQQPDSGHQPAGTPETNRVRRRRPGSAAAAHACAVAAGLLLFVWLAPAEAQRWIGFGAQARGMAQAITAHAGGQAALFWNPAGLALAEPSALQIRAEGIGDVRLEGPVIEAADRLADLFRDRGFQSAQDRLDAGAAGAADLETALEAVDALVDLTAPGRGLLGDAGFSVAIGRGPWAFAHRTLVRVGAAGVVDLGPGTSALSAAGLAGLRDSLDAIVAERRRAGLADNVPATTGGADLAARLRALGNERGVAFARAAADQFGFSGETVFGDRLTDEAVRSALDDVLASTAAAAVGSDVRGLARSGSGVRIRGVILQELDLGRAWSRGPPDRALRLGAALRLVFGRTFERLFTMAEIEDGGQLRRDLFGVLGSGRRESVRATLDVGAQLELGPRWRVGLAARNLVPVSFPFASTGSFDLRPQLRGGIAWRPLATDRLTIAADADLNVSATDALPGFRSRRIAAGAELRLGRARWDMRLRAGAYHELLAPGRDVVVSAGVEGRYRGLFLGAQVQRALATENLESPSTGSPARRMPAQIGASVSMSMRF